MKSRAVACAFLAVACGGSTPSPSKPVAALPPAHTVSKAPPPATAPAPAAAASAFKVIGEVGDVQLFGAGERGFLLSQMGVELVIVGDDVLQEPLLKRGVEAQAGLMAVEAIAGRWPDALWLSTTEASGRSGFSTVWSWDGKSWQRKQHTKEGLFITGVQAWLGGRMLALRQAGMAFDASFLLLSGDSHVVLPEFSRVKQTDEFSPCATNLKVDAWSALPGGEVVALGERCDTGNYELALERWAAGAKQSTLDTLPETRPSDSQRREVWTTPALGALAPNDIFVAAVKETAPVQPSDAPWEKTDYFAHFDGKGWQKTPVPIPEGVSNLWVEKGGVLFASNRNEELWSRSVKGAWARVPWPEELLGKGTFKLEGFWPRAPGDVWALVTVLSSNEGHRYLLHTRPAPHPLPTSEAMELKEREYRLPGPPVDGCATPFVLLYTLGRKAPASYDYPATREALKGHLEFAASKFVEFERDGRKFFGARVPDFKLGKKLAQLVKDHVVGSTPELVCHDPIDTRSLDIDLKTGRLRASQNTPPTR
jgi:hypothetical protein